MKTVDLVYFNAGGGHRAAALAIEQAAQEEQRPWRVRRVNLTEVLDPRGQFQRITGFAPEELYNLRLKRGWTLGLAQELKLLQAGIRLAHGAMLRLLQRHWAGSEPDLVVSLIPNFTRVLNESVTSTLPGVPFVTVLTDLADHPPHFWIEPGLQASWICGTARAAAQAREMGYREAQIVRVSGMVLRPAFHNAPTMTEDQRRERLGALGLDPMQPVGAVMYGGHGSAQMLRVARALSDRQLILFAGRNAPLAARLRGLKRPAPQAVLGFIDDVAAVLRLADFFIGKPGPGALSEALQLGLPVLTFRNAWTMPQERYNTVWVEEQGVGRVVASVRELPDATRALLANIDAHGAAAARLNNRAVYEVTAALARQLEPAPAALPAGLGLGLGLGPELEPASRSQTRSEHCCDR